MAITATLKSQRTQSDGRKLVQIDFNNDSGFIYSTRLNVGSDWNFAAQKSELETQALDRLKQKELDNMPALVGSGLSPAELLTGATYCTPQEIIREGVRYGLEIDDVTSVALMQGIYEYLNATYTADEIAGLTGYTVETINQFNSRMAATFKTGDVATQILEIEGLQGVAE